MKKMKIEGQFCILKVFLGSSDVSLRQINQVIHCLGLVMASWPNVRDPIFRMVVEVALVMKTIDSDRYWRFVRGNITDKELVDSLYKRVATNDKYFEYIVVIAAKEIKSKTLKAYDPKIKSPLIDRYYNQNRDDFVKEFVKFEEEYQGLYARMGAFLDAVRTIEYFGKYSRWMRLPIKRDSMRVTKPG